MPDASIASLGRRIVRGMFVILFFGLFAKLGGFLMGVVIVNFYGSGVELDAYSAIYKVLIYVFVYSSILKVVLPAFMPLFAEKMEREGEESAWQFASSIINLTLLGGLALVVVGMLGAAGVTRTLLAGFEEGPGAEGKRLALATRLLRIMLPGAAGMIFAIVAQGLLNSYKVFSYPPAGEAAQKLIWVGGLVLLLVLFPLSPMAIGAAFLGGCAGQLAVNLCGLRRKLGLYRPSIPLATSGRCAKEAGVAALFAALFAGWVVFVLKVLAPREIAGDWQLWVINGGLAIGALYAGHLWFRARKRAGLLARFAALAAPLALGVLFARYRDIGTAYFQSYTKTGIFGDIELARPIANLPMVLIAYSLSVAMFPYLCDLAAKRDVAAFGDLLGRTLRTIALFFIPLTVAVVLLAVPIVTLVYDRGTWSPLDARYAGLALAIFAVGLFFFAIENVIMQSFFSLQRVWTPTILGMVAAVLQVGLIWLLTAPLKLDYPFQVFVIVVAAFPATRILKNLVLLGIMRARIPMLPFRQTAGFAVKLGVVCCGIWAAIRFSAPHVERAVHPARYRGREAMLDTFNREANGWFSRNAAELVVREEDATGNGVLSARYTRSPHLQVSITRDLSDFAGDIREIRLRLRADPACDLALSFSVRDGAARITERLDGGAWRTVTLVLPMSATGAPRELTITDVTPVKERDEATVLIDDVTLLRSVGTAVTTDGVKVLTLRREVVVDDFDQGQRIWAGDGPVAVGPVPGAADKRESALEVPAGTRSVWRSLAGLRLDDVKALEFKYKADAPTGLRVSIATQDGEEFTHDLGVLPAAEKRERRAVDLDEFRDAAGRSLDLQKAPAFELRFMRTTGGEAGGGSAGVQAATSALWLDNVAFVRPPRRLFYEAAKFVAVAIPAFLGVIAFAVLAYLLRIEEARAVTVWLREQGLDRIRRRLSRNRKGEDGAGAPPAQPDLP